MAEAKLKGMEIYRYNKQTLSKTRQMSLQKVCFCMMKHGLLNVIDMLLGKGLIKEKKRKKFSQKLVTHHNGT